ncbi:MAG TPA: hypothetical protein VFM69_00800 [Pricia sp.]|nr:hypothetical protein [Pricia sp.]
MGRIIRNRDTDKPRRVGRDHYPIRLPGIGRSNYLLILSLFIGILLATGCSSTTVLLANFKNDTIGSPPAAAQPTGTVSLVPGAGIITVVAAPRPELPVNNWCQIGHPTAQSDLTQLTGKFTQFGIGSYGLLASMHIPSGSGVVTVQFEASEESPLPFGDFLHLDFMPEGDVRIDDGSSRFGNFPRDKNFVLSVNLVITATTATAEISLLGGEASGSTNVTIGSNVLALARQFGAVSFHVGFLHKATFFVDDIIVTRKNQ